MICKEKDAGNKSERNDFMNKAWIYIILTCLFELFWVYGFNVATAWWHWSIVVAIKLTRGQSIMPVAPCQVRGAKGKNESKSSSTNKY
jgi:hypothetical protein